MKPASFPPQCRTRNLAVILLLAACWLSGCTVTFSGIGALVRSEPRPTRDYAPVIVTPNDFERVFDIELGDEITLVLRDGRQFEGQYLALIPPAGPSLPALIRLHLLAERRKPGQVGYQRKAAEAARKVIEVSTADLSQLRYPSPVNTTLIGFAVGAVADLITILTIREALRNTPLL